jgi:hypothetical protein
VGPRTIPGGFGFVPVDGFAATDPLLVPQALVPGGSRAPDVVGNLRIDQSWGSAQLSAAAHEVRAVNVTGVTAAGDFFVGIPGTAPAGLTGLDSPDSEWGYAIQGGVKFNLPMIAAGDQLWLQAAYGSGATGYTHVDDFTAARAGTIRVATPEAIINPVTGDIEKTDSWSVSGKFLHYWLPNLRSNFFGAYSEVDFDASGTQAFVNPADPSFIVNAGFVDFKIYEAGANLVWSPVKGLDIGVEGVYRKIETSGRVAPEFGPNAFVIGAGVRDPRLARDNADAWEARLRVQRDF